MRNKSTINEIPIWVEQESFLWREKIEEENRIFLLLKGYVKNGPHSLLTLLSTQCFQMIVVGKGRASRIFLTDKLHRITGYRYRQIASNHCIYIQVKILALLSKISTWNTPLIYRNKKFPSILYFLGFK